MKKINTIKKDNHSKHQQKHNKEAEQAATMTSSKQQQSPTKIERKITYHEGETK